jgi:hypothetical protein
MVLELRSSGVNSLALGAFWRTGFTIFLGAHGTGRKAFRTDDVQTSVAHQKFSMRIKTGFTTLGVAVSRKINFFCIICLNGNTADHYV